MARIRTIKPEFWQDEKLSPMPPITRLVFLGLIGMADDAGRLLDNVKVIDAFIFADSSETCRGSLDDLSAIGRIRRGLTASGQRIIEITNWSRHQKIEKPNFRGALPALETETVGAHEVTEIPRRVADVSPTPPRSFPDESPNHTYDLRPTTSTNDQYQLAPDAHASDAVVMGSTVRPRKPRTPRPPAEPSASMLAFPKAVCDQAFEYWADHVGAVDYGQFRKAFALVFRVPDAERPPTQPRDAELIPVIRLYLAAIKGTTAAQFVSPANCAKYASALARAIRDADGDTELRLTNAQHIVGVAEQARRMMRAAA